MLHELKRYEAHPGKAGALQARFAAVTAPIFARLGIQLVHHWLSPQEPQALYYLVAFADAPARAAAWAAFAADPEWQAAKAASELDGPLLAAQATTLLEPQPLTGTAACQEPL